MSELKPERSGPSLADQMASKSKRERPFLFPDPKTPSSRGIGCCGEVSGLALQYTKVCTEFALVFRDEHCPSDHGVNHPKREPVVFKCGKRRCMGKVPCSTPYAYVSDLSVVACWIAPWGQAARFPRELKSYLV